MKELNKLKSEELKKLCSRLKIEISSKLKKKDLINLITKHYEDNKYKKIKQIGNKGKEGITYIVSTPELNIYAMKCFKPTKSSKRLSKEGKLQKIASQEGIAPKVIEINEEKKFIVMEKMDKHLTYYLKKQNGDLTLKQQKQLINVYKKLDKCKVFHGDSNILNYMYKNKKLYIIDFGMSKKIDDKLIKELGTNTPNLDIMTLAFILKLKEFNCPPSSYNYLLKFISDYNKIQFNLI